MAEAIILPIANSVLQKIASFTGDLVTQNVAVEIKAFNSVKKDLKAIAKNLSSITSVLRDAETKQYNSTAMMVWLHDLKNIVYDIDDLFDDAATDSLQKGTNKRHFLPRLRYYLSLKPLFSRLHLINRIKGLRLELEHIVVEKNKFRLRDHPIESPSNAEDVFDVCRYENDIAIVGREEDKLNIMNKVLDLGDECNLSVLPIVGVGGIGKTTLAKLVYRDIDQFDIKMWVCVSDKFDIQTILEDILKDAGCENTLNFSLRKLVEKLQDVLSGKKFFLVLDNFWEYDIESWIELKNVLAVGGKGSVILITMRTKYVDSISDIVEPYYLGKLSDSICWLLFKKLAFADGEEERYPRLCEIGVSIVETCYGNPLVVRSLGSLLRHERKKWEWLQIKYSMHNLIQLDGDYWTVERHLKLSCDKLPSHLKPCFAHLSLYPKDYEFVPYYIFYCWSALGLLNVHDGRCFKENLFEQLLSRSMLQDVKWNFNNTIGAFKMHDLSHHLARDVLKSELTVISMDSFYVPSSSRYIAWGLKNLSLWGSRDTSDREILEQFKSTKARAFIFHYAMRSVSQTFLNDIISCMPHLRILGLGRGQLEELPSSVQNLKLLRVLDLSNNCLIKSLPETVSELLNLQCLLLDGCRQLEKLPIKMYKLTSLRFLSLTTCQRSLAGTKFNRLPSLQHLWLVSCLELVSLWDTEDAGHLTSLRSLLINDCPKLTSLPNSMKQLVGLEELLIKNCEELDLERGKAMSNLQSLQSLAIEGVPHLSCLPNGIQSAASSLKYLWIKNCGGLAELPEWLQSFTRLQYHGDVQPQTEKTCL